MFFRWQLCHGIFQVCATIACLLFMLYIIQEFYVFKFCMFMLDGVLLNRTYPHFLKWLIGRTGDDWMIKDYFGRQVWVGGAVAVEW